MLFVVDVTRSDDDLDRVGQMQVKANSARLAIQEVRRLNSDTTRTDTGSWYGKCLTVRSVVAAYHTTSPLLGASDE